MPLYNFSCTSCNKVFERICKVDEGEVNCWECNSPSKRIISLNIPKVLFKDPRGTNKWEEFDYRAEYNMEKAKAERRAAEELSKSSSPYSEINDFDIKGVFDEGGVDNEEFPGLQIPK